MAESLVACLGLLQDSACECESKNVELANSERLFNTVGLGRLLKCTKTRSLG